MHEALTMLPEERRMNTKENRYFKNIQKKISACIFLITSRKESMTNDHFIRINRRLWVIPSSTPPLPENKPMRRKSAPGSNFSANITGDFIKNHIFRFSVRQLEFWKTSSSSGVLMFCQEERRISGTQGVSIFGWSATRLIFLLPC